MTDLTMFEIITIPHIVVLFGRDSDEVDFFFKQIEEGLTDFHITVKGGITDDEKRDCVREAIRTWDDGVIIENL